MEKKILIMDKTRKKVFLLLLSFVFILSFGWTTSVAKTTIEFIQWWAPELPAGSFRGIMDDFESKNPDIKVKLISGPYSSTRDQIVIGAASGTLSDVVGLDGAWVNDLAKQGAIAPMDGLMSRNNYDSSQIAAIIKIDGKSLMFPVASFVYPIFINLDFGYGLTLDKRDQSFKPSEGYKVNFVQTLPLIFDSSSVYNSLNVTTYHDFSDDVIGSVKFLARSITGLDDDVRLTNRLYTGSKHIRGFVPGKMGPKDGKDFIGGNYAYALNYTSTIPQILEQSQNVDFVFFIDAANVWGVDYDKMRTFFVDTLKSRFEAGESFETLDDFIGQVKQGMNDNPGDQNWSMEGAFSIDGNGAEAGEWVNAWFLVDASETQPKREIVEYYFVKNGKIHEFTQSRQVRLD